MKMTEYISNDTITEIEKYLSCDLETIDVYIRILSAAVFAENLISDNSDSKSKTQIDKLISLCLVSDYVGRDKRKVFFPIDPQFAFPALMLREMWNYDVNLHTIDDLLKHEELLELNLKYKSCKRIVKSIEHLYRKQLPFLKEMAVVIKGHRHIAMCISELLDTANTEIYAMVSPPHLLGEIVWQTVVGKMQQGIIYNRITTFNEIIRHGYFICKNEVLNYNERLFICKDENLSHKFYVINNITVAFFIPDIINRDFKFEAQIIKNSGFSNRYMDIFNKIKSESYELVDILDLIAEFRNKYIASAKSALSDEELMWLVDIFDYGIYIKKEKYLEEVYNSAKEKSIRNKYITINDKNEIYANYSLQEVLCNATI